MAAPRKIRVLWPEAAGTDGDRPPWASMTVAIIQLSIPEARPSRIQVLCVISLCVIWAGLSLSARARAWACSGHPGLLQGLFR